MPFKGMLSACVALTASLMLSLSLCGDVSAQTKTSATGVCLRCHEAGLPLPAGHAKVTGAAIAECGACHVSQAGQAKHYPFAARLHRAHVAVQLDCTACHAFAPGKRFSAATHKGNLGALDIEQYERLRKAVATYAASTGIATKHGAKYNLSCGACHGKQLIPDDNETLVNKQCVSCHGSYDRLAVVTKAKLANPDVNPHGSHMGPQVACTACHAGHAESKSYCLHCHTNFNQPMP